MAQLADKTAYHELTETQQAVVDELAKDPDADNTVIADRAGCARSTVYNVKEHYPEIVETQLDRRGRHDGKETTEGDPFEGKLEANDGWQTLAERPVQGDDMSADADDESESDPYDLLEEEIGPEWVDDRGTDATADDGDEDSVPVEATEHEGDNRRVPVVLDEQTVRDILTGKNPERVRARVMESVVDRAFETAT